MRKRFMFIAREFSKQYLRLTMRSPTATAIQTVPTGLPVLPVGRQYPDVAIAQSVFNKRRRILSHLFHNFTTHDSVFFYCRRIDIQNLHLHFIGIRYHTPFIIGRTAGYQCNFMCDISSVQLSAVAIVNPL